MPEKGDSSNQLKLLRHARDQILKEWDVSFAINGEVLTNIMGFISDINTDVPIKFYKEKIFINLKSPDNIQYTEIEINSSDVLDYNPGLEGDPNRKDIKSITKGTGPDGDYKAILIDVRGTMDEVSSFAQKDDLIQIKVDTFYQKRIEFHCPGNMVIWARLLDPTNVLKGIEKLPEIIKNQRNNPNIKKASAIIEPATFMRICSIGGKSGKKRDIDERIFVELDKRDGLYITSGDGLKGRIFELRPTEYGNITKDLEHEEGFNEGQMVEKEGMEEMEGMEGMEQGVPYEERVDNGLEEEIPSDEKVPEEKISSDEMQEAEGFVPDFVPEFAQSREDKERKRNEKRRPENKSTVDQLLGIEADAPQYVYLSKEFIIPFTKLKGLSPIVVEVRTDKPIILEQRPYNGIKVLLTVAPRIESEDDK